VYSVRGYAKRDPSTGGDRVTAPFIQFGFDPGAKGGWAAVSDACRLIGCGKLFPFDQAYAQIRRVLDEARIGGVPVFGAFEAVHAFGHDGRSSTHQFGRNVGETIGLLKGLNFWPVVFVPPQKWQHRMRCATGGDKRITYAKAALLFPEIEMSHFIADALLITEDARRERLKV
jgi:hypothetical protein